MKFLFISCLLVFSPMKELKADPITLARAVVAIALNQGGAAGGAVLQRLLGGGGSTIARMANLLSLALINQGGGLVNDEKIMAELSKIVGSPLANTSATELTESELTNALTKIQDKINAMRATQIIVDENGDLVMNCLGVCAALRIKTVAASGTANPSSQAMLQEIIKALQELIGANGPGGGGPLQKFVAQELTKRNLTDMAILFETLKKLQQSSNDNPGAKGVWEIFTTSGITPTEAKKIIAETGLLSEIIPLSLSKDGELGTIAAFFKKVIVKIPEGERTATNVREGLRKLFADNPDTLKQLKDKGCYKNLIGWTA